MIKKVCFYIFLFFCLTLNIILDFNISNYFKILELCFGITLSLSTNLYIRICIIIAIITVFIILNVILVCLKITPSKIEIKPKENDSTHGTATWMQEDEMKNILGFNDTPGLILGTYNEKIITLPFESFFNKNISVFGSSGSMKTTSFLLPNLLELSKFHKSIIVTDPKAEIYRITSTFFKKKNYIVKVFNLKDIKHSDRWNPLRRKRNNYRCSNF